MKNFGPFTNRSNCFNNQKNINNQKIYNFRMLNSNLKTNNNNNNNYYNMGNIGPNFNKDSKISRQAIGINKTPAKVGQYSNRFGSPYNNGSNMKNYIFNSPPAPLINPAQFSALNNIQPLNLNINNRYQNQPINTNNNNIQLNNNINTNKSKDNKINNFIKNNNNNAKTRNQDNLTSNEEDYTIEVLKSKHIFKVKTKNYNQEPINQKLQLLKNRDNNITDEENNFCKGNNDNNIRNTVFYINEAFNTHK
jgi:hypothetical protein